MRQATLNDLPRVAEIFELCKRQMREAGSDQWDEIYPTAANAEADINASNLYIAGIDEISAGSVCLNEEQAPEYAGLAWQDTEGRVLAVHRLCVDPALQNRGVAARLMDFAEDYARNNHYTSVRLDTYMGNPKAISLYERRGYQRTGQIRFPRRKMLFDCFEKRLSLSAKIQP